MAEKLKQALGLEAVSLISGRRGEFSVRVDEQIVASKGSDFPSDAEVVASVSRAIQ